MNPHVVAALNALEESDEFDSVEVVGEYEGKDHVEVEVQLTRHGVTIPMYLEVPR